MAGVRAAGRGFRAVNLPSLALAGNLRAPLACLDDTELSVADERHRLGDFAAGWCRLVDVFAAAPTGRLATTAAGQTEAWPVSARRSRAGP
jgi:hypothetical protein